MPVVRLPKDDPAEHGTGVEVERLNTVSRPLHAHMSIMFRKLGVASRLELGGC